MEKQEGKLSGLCCYETFSDTESSCDMQGKCGYQYPLSFNKIFLDFFAFVGSK